MPRPRVEWLQTARSDVLSIIDYIAEASPRAAQQLKGAIEGKICRLPDHPRLYRIGRVAGTREMVIRATYVVIYTEAIDCVTILRVLHGAQQWPPVQN